ncbi:MAG: TraR/DksA C4-type zinc finger protein [Chloroflexi bacterium]|nr:TraR/DksA C4-type zinc finger protein [Chloroflexota bacterium]
MVTETPNIEMIKQMLETEREKLLAQLQLSSEDDTSVAINPDQMDNAQAYNEQDLSQALQTFEEKQLVQIEIALKAIAQGNYGRCQYCQQPIPLERLQVMPNATMCVDCQRLYD